MNLLPSGRSLASGLTEPFRIAFTHRTTGATGTIQVSETVAFLGRHSQNSLALNDPSVSRRHAYVQVVDRCVYVVDLKSRSGLRIAGVPAREGWVNPGQVLQVGVFDIEFAGPLQDAGNRPSPIAQPSESLRLRLAFSAGTEDQGRIVSPIQNPLTVIGKDSHCNLRLIDQRINSFHASIVKTDRDAWIINIPGSGGVRLNDRLVRSSVLQVGDRISLNGLSMEVQLNRAEVAATNGAVTKMPSDLGELLPFAMAVDESQPLAEQVSELRQATMMMATLFAEMKREQSQLMHRQMELMEMMTQAFRESRSNGHAISQGTAGTIGPAPVAGALPKPITPLQVPHMSDPADAAKLAEAHEWFMAKLGKMNPKT